MLTFGFGTSLDDLLWTMRILVRRRWRLRIITPIIITGIVITPVITPIIAPIITAGIKREMTQWADST